MCVPNAMSMHFNVPFVAALFAEHVRGALCAGMVSAVERTPHKVLLVISFELLTLIIQPIPSNFFLSVGGHVDCMMQWFKQQKVCPTGCGCICKLGNPTLPAYPHTNY